MHIKSENFIKIVQTSDPEGQIYGQNSKFWQFLGLYSHISALINVKFSIWGADLWSAPHAKFHVYRGNV